MTFGSSLRQLMWVVPFIGLGLMALVLVRSPPAFPLPSHYRTVTDGEGGEVAVPLPVRVVRCTGGGDYLETTHAPDALYKAGSGGAASARMFAASILGHIYPKLAKNSSLWDCPTEIESILAEDSGATYLKSGAYDKHLRGVGLPVVALSGARNINLVRTEAAVLGHEAYGETLLANQAQRYADIETELQPETLTDWPRAVPMGSSPRDWSHIWTEGTDWPVSDRLAGIRNASEGFKAMGRQQEAERVLAMNPDIIFYHGKCADDLLNDPRWKGLKAVKDRKVYVAGARNFRGVIQVSWNFDINPLITRWEAEIAHPERLRPKLRELMRAHFLQAYGYRLSDDEIDDLMRLEENKGATGYARFIKNDRAEGEDHAQQ